MKIPPNPLICAGDKITVLLQNKTADKEKVEEPFDENLVEFICQRSHTSLQFGEGGNGNITTTLRLFRDSYGMGELASGQVENK